jgi:deoxyribodipyrimidine photo-lyase
MAANERRLAGAPVLYYPYVERAVDEGKGLLAALARRAVVVVGDDFPAFFLPRMADAAARQVPVRFELVDSNGLVPVRAAGRDFPSAFTFRRFLQRVLPAHLADEPRRDPLSRVRLPVLGRLPAAIMRQWARASPELLRGGAGALAALPIDHRVPPAAFRGGSAAAESALREFVSRRLARYPEKRNQPEENGTSGLSPYLHFGHISVHDVLHRIAAAEGWTPDRVAPTATGRRERWWRRAPRPRPSSTSS